VIVTPGAGRGLVRCRRFFERKNALASRRAATAISQRFSLLETNPEIGRPLPDEPGLRELIIGFGDLGYVALYRFDPTADAVYILAFRHQREAGY
jgi:plasmid stabilization system protein ParE